VGFYCEGVDTEGGAVADVGDGVEDLGLRTFADGEGGDVDAVGGEEFWVGCEVDGGDGVGFAVAAAWGWAGIDGEGAPEEGAGVGDVACGDELADAAGGDGGAANNAGSVDGDAEAEFLAEGFQAGVSSLGAAGAGLGVVAEAEVFALVDLGDVEGVDEDVGDEIAGRHVAELVGEGEDEGGVEAGVGEEFEAAMERGDEGKRRFGTEDAGGVRVEGDSEGPAAEEARVGQDFGDDRLMAQMHAVEVADGGDYGGGRGGEVGELAVDFQGQLLVVSS